MHPRTLLARALARVAACALVLCVVACAAPGDPGRHAAPLRLVLRADLAQLGIARLSVEITGPGIDTPITTDLTITNGVASGTVEVPAGPARVVTVHGFDAQGTETYRGAATVDVTAGETVTANITLRSLTSSVTITVTVASVSVTIAPAAPSPRAGEQITLSATATELNGVPLPAPTFRWTSLRPPVAFVDATGRLTALDTGVARIAVATGTAGQVVSFRVRPGTTLLDAQLAPGSVTLGGASATAVVRVTLRDDGAGVDSIRVRLQSPTGAAGPTCGAAAPVPGTTRTSPTFACPLVVPAGSAGGDWPVASIAVHGTVTTTYDASLLAAAGIRARLTVTP